MQHFAYTLFSVEADWPHVVSVDKLRRLQHFVERGEQSL